MFNNISSSDIKIIETLCKQPGSGMFKDLQNNEKILSSVLRCLKFYQNDFQSVKNSSIANTAYDLLLIPTILAQPYYTSTDTSMGEILQEVLKDEQIDLLSEVCTTVQKFIHANKMNKNSWKAINERLEFRDSCFDVCRADLNDLTQKSLWPHLENRIAELEADPCPSWEEVQNSTISANWNEKTNFSIGATALQGKRPTMEDQHFHLENDERILTGVFDGHHGNAVVNYVHQEFQKTFDQILEECKFDFYRAFHEVALKIDHNIYNDKTLRNSKSGCTAVVCYLNKKDGMLYTFTLGDSEAYLYRKINGEQKSIPLSAVRDWLSAKDLTRLKSAKGKVESEGREVTFADRFSFNPKKIRSPKGLNVSRSFGDCQDPTVIAKPKISQHHLKQGDRLILCCDGLIDSRVTQKNICDLLKNSCASSQELSSELAHNAVNTVFDNVSVIVIKVGEDHQPPSL